jgi:beta-galactosidase
MRLATLLPALFLIVPLYAQRLHLAINDGWEFIKWDMAQLTGGELPPWQSVAIPHTWNDKDAQSGLGMYQGYGWYRRSLDIKSEWEGQRVFLRFEGVGSVADVYVNDSHVGQHKGAYSAFCFDITSALKFGGPNEIRVRADNRARPDVIPVNHYLFAVFGGIYRPVTMIVAPPVHITPLDYGSPGVYIKQNKVDKTEASIEVTAKLANASKALSDLTLSFEVRDGQGKAVAAANAKALVRPSGVHAFKQALGGKWNGKKKR